MRNHFISSLICVFDLMPAPAAIAAMAPPELEIIQVTATRIPATVNSVPASISVIGGAELQQRGANDLRSALSLLAGVDIAPGGDGGPAASVPGLWGLREFDAFLLVVDGVPRGGAFNPALASVVLSDIERIEVLRGAAPVMYGATSFVGVIHVIHRAAGDSEQLARITRGSFDSTIFAASTTLPPAEGYRHSLALDGERRGYSDSRAGVDRAHALYRGAVDTRDGVLRLDADLSWLRQDPASPHLREGAVLAPGLPLDANHNPADARLDEDRYQLTAAYDSRLAGSDWTTTLSITRSHDDIVRGFIDEEFVDDGVSPNAAGFVQDRGTWDLYFDSHFSRSAGAGLDLLYGFDYLYGKADQMSRNFDYHVASDGSLVPASSAFPIESTTDLQDSRHFAGVYLQMSWNVSTHVGLLTGLRLNRTAEERASEGDSARLTRTRLGGVIGITWKLWEQARDSLAVFTDYRNTYKPAAVDLGPEADAGILQPETAASYEAGIRGRWLDGRMSVEISVFDMQFDNLVVTQSVNGRPGLTNAGQENFRGFESEVRFQIATDFLLAANYARHEARFDDYVQLFGSTSVQLDGNYLEMSPRHVGGLGLNYQPAYGWHGSFVWNHVGSRFLNKRNTAKAKGFNTLDASLGYRLQRWNLGFAVHNLTDERPPVAESELGESQYYRLPARSTEFTITRLF